MQRLFVALLLTACASAEPGVRKDVAKECSGTSDCPVGAQCSAGVCQSEPSTLRCHDDSECPSAQSCVNGGCRAVSAPPPQPKPPGRGG